MINPLYTYPLRVAIQLHELNNYRESKRENIACRKDIETMLRTNFDGCSLYGGCAKEICEKYGTERVGWVLANTVQHYTWDGRFRQTTKDWADKFPIPTAAEDMTTDYCVRTHPEILNGFINQYRKYVQSMDVLDSSSCVYGSQSSDYRGKLMILKPNALCEKYRKSEFQYFLATSGFGCDPTKIGGKVFGCFLADNEFTQFRRGDFLGEADSYGLPDWVKDKLEEVTDIDDDIGMKGMEME